MSPSLTAVRKEKQRQSMSIMTIIATPPAADK